MESVLPMLWAVLASTAAVLAGLAAFLLLRARDRVLRQAAELTQDLDKLNDRLWALADSEERYRSLIEAQGDLIVRRNEGRIIYANAAYAALLGASETEIVGSRLEPRLVASPNASPRPTAANAGSPGSRPSCRSRSARPCCSGSGATSRLESPASRR
jgi:PAS domain-containing protein